MRNRLPPGQTETKKWPVLDLGVQPQISLKDWRFSVSGLVNAAIEWDWKTFMEQPQVGLVTDFHCVTSWSRYDNLWRGVSAKHLLSVVKPKPEARFLTFHSHDGYATNVPLKRFNTDDALLAHSWQGEPLAVEHGGPVRVVIPQLYFWKSAKWVKHVTFTERDIRGYWETRGYHNDADPWKEERYG